MAVGMLSQLIEAIPELDASHCVLIAGVPKQPGAAWTAAGIDDTTTTRLYLNTSGNWATTSAASNERACAAAAAAAGDTTGSIYLYPAAKIGAYSNLRTDAGAGVEIGSYAVVNESPQQLATVKDIDAAWITSQSIYWDWAQGKAFNTNGATRMTFEFTDRASPAGSNRGLVAFNYGYYEDGARQLPFNVDPIVLPKIAGEGNVNDDSTIAVDVSGNYFSFTYFLPAVRHGIFDDTWSLEAPAISADHFYGYEHRASTKMYGNHNLMMSSVNPQFVYILPTFGVNLPSLLFTGVDQVLNSQSYNVVDNPIPGGTFNDVLARAYPFYYTIRKYRVLDEGGVSYIKKGWKPNITADIPAVTYTRTPPAGGDTAEFTPHTPPDYSSSHQFVLTASYANTFNPTWELRRKEPLPAAAGSYYEPEVNGHQAPPLAYQGTSYFFCLPDQNGSTQVTPLTDPVYAVDLDKQWEYGSVTLEGGAGVGTGLISHRFVRLNADGTETELMGWTDMTKTAWVSHEGTDYIRWTGSKSLADLGFTDPLMYSNNVRMDGRFYYISISPYDSFSCYFGNPYSHSTNYKGSINKWNPENQAPFPFDLYPRRLRTNMGDEVETSFSRGYHHKFKDTTVSYTGSFTHSVTSVGGKFYTITTTSNITPACADTDLVSINRLGEVMRRIVRKRDGMAPWQYFQAKSTHGGIVYAPKGKPWFITPSSPTNGTGILSSFPIAYTLAPQLIDIAPDRIDEEFEVETIIMLQMNWKNREVTYYTIREVADVNVP